MQKRYIYIGVVVILVVLQFFGIDKTNPPIEPGQDFIAIERPPQEIAVMIKDACYDCHSHHTKYPWYTYITPLSWWIGGHIDHGREELNFSEWKSYSPSRAAHKLEESYELTVEKHMPLGSYTWTHPNARLKDMDIKRLAEWFKERAEVRGQ